MNFPAKREWETVYHYKIRIAQKAMQVRTLAGAQSFVDEYIKYLNTLGLSDAIGDDPTVEYEPLKQDACAHLIFHAKQQTHWPYDRVNRVVALYETLLRERVEIEKITPPQFHLYFNTVKLASLNEYELAAVRVKIKLKNLSGYYLLSNGEKIRIDTNGTLEKDVPGLDLLPNLLMKLI